MQNRGAKLSTLRDERAQLLAIFTTISKKIKVFPFKIHPSTFILSACAAYGSHYGSGKLFRFLGQHVVNDHIHLHVKIHAERLG